MSGRHGPGVAGRTRVRGLGSCFARLTKSAMTWETIAGNRMERPSFDRLDVRIIRELTQAQELLAGRPGLPGSYRQIARKVGAHSGTVRNRLLRMYRAGVLTGFSTYPNPNLLGIQVFAYAFDVGVDVPKPEVVGQLRRLDGVAFLHDFHGPAVGMVFACAPGEPAEARMAEINRIADAVPWRVTPVDFPPGPEGLTDSDRVFVRRLLRGGFRTYADLAAELGLSLRTVKRRFARLTDCWAVFSLPTIDYRAISGSVPADLQVAYRTPSAQREAEPAVLRMVGDHLIFAGPWTGFSLYSMILPKVGMLTDLAERLRQIPGVEAVRAGFVDERIDQAWVFGRYPWLAAPIPGATRGPRRAAA
jgi:DNA-binding Lrp family transcriptional regulator